MRPFRLLAIDPGTNFAGFSILTFDGDKNQPVVEYVSHYDARSNKTENLKIEQPSNLMINKYQDILNIVDDLVGFYQPQFVVCESPFVGRNIQSYGTAMGLLKLMESLIRGKYISTDFYTLAPRIIKQFAGVDGAEKELMVEALAKKKNIIYKNTKTIDEMIFDEVDSVWIGLTALDTLFDFTLT